MMRIKFEIGNKEYSCSIDHPYDISIPVLFNGEQPNSYGVNKAAAMAVETGDFIGDTRRGGSCNFEEYRLIPHCNGTHTEGVGHISLERIPVNEILNDVLIPSTLITVESQKANDTVDKYIPEKNPDDFLITKKILEDKLNTADENFLRGLIVRTLPNDDSKKKRQYMKDLPPFFSIEAIEYIVSLNVEHLMVDIPSVDRTFDEGKLTVHHIFWNVKSESHEVKKNHSTKTITEMIYVTEKVPDGKYLTSIQIPNFRSDAAPSRVFIFSLISS